MSVLYWFGYTYQKELQLKGLGARQDFTLHSSPSPSPQCPVPRQTGQLDCGEPSDIWLKMTVLFHHLDNLTTAGIIWPDLVQVFI